MLHPFQASTPHFIHKSEKKSYHTAVDIEPPVTDKILLIVKGAIGA